jgi:hypothetical protein
MIERFRRNGQPPGPDLTVVELEHICLRMDESLKALATIATLLVDTKDLLTRIDGRLDRLEARLT